MTNNINQKIKINTMETNTLTKTENRIESNILRELSTTYNEFIEKLKKSLKGKEHYRLTSDLVTIDLSKHDIGIRDIKRFKRYLKQAVYIRSINSINKLFNLVYKKILKMDKYPKLICDKHDKIQKLRADWKKQQLIADQLLTDYKNEKGDFYKTDLKF